MSNAVAKLNPVDDLRQSISTVEFAPFRLGGHQQLESHGEHGLLAQATLGSLGQDIWRMSADIIGELYGGRKY